MMIKELSYPVARFLSPYPGEPEQMMDGRLTFTFYLRPSAGGLGDVLMRYNDLGRALHQTLESCVRGRLLLGPSDSVDPSQAHRVFAVTPDCGSLGTYLLRDIFTSYAQQRGFNIEKLSVTFGVFEKATCYPRRDPTTNYVYHAQRDEKAEESEI